MNNVLVSRKSDEWKTPENIYNYFIKRGYFDPCPINHKQNGLEIEWHYKNFVNPPYSNIKSWVEKGIKEYDKGNKVVFLIPARTDTKYFRWLCSCHGYIQFISGRLKFNNGKGNAPFPSMLVTISKEYPRRAIYDCSLIDELLIYIEDVP